MQRDSQRIYDEFLVSAALTGDAPAWNRLVARWQPRLLRHAWRLLGDGERALDCVQEAWVEIVQGLKRLQDVAAFPAWALQIVTRRCHRRIPESRRERLHADADDCEIAAPPPPLDDALDVRTLCQAMQTLPAAHRAALALFYLDGLGVAEIAVALDVPPGTVKTRLMHARQKLRAILEGVST